MNRKVVVGMSGGVDSSAAAYLLLLQGYDVIGVTMQVWDASDGFAAEREGGCCGTSAVEDAGAVCETLGIPYFVMNWRGTFEKDVIDPFVHAYCSGCTPNPCVACNRCVKWQALLDAAKAVGADYVATGHYAGIRQLGNGRFSICNAKYAAKDQTYALCMLTQEQLSRTLMPLSSYSKEEVREIAKKAGIRVYAKPDSQEICFVSDDDYAGFVEKNAREPVPGPGNFVDREGKVLGQHRGIIHYTIGQRKGLGIPFGQRIFVTGIDPEKNEVVLGPPEEVFSEVLHCGNVNYMGCPHMEEGETRRFSAAVRYGGIRTDCCVRLLPGGILEAEFDRPVRAVTPGQYAVFYDGEHIACAGVILRRKNLS